MARRAQAKPGPTTSGPTKQARRREVGRLEWVVGALGAAITLGVFGTLAYEAATFEDGPPILVAHFRDVSRTEGGYVARFEVENRGFSTAADVTVRATLKDGDRVIEESDATLDYVARKSRREGGVVLRRDPATATLEIVATSYRKP